MLLTGLILFALSYPLEMCWPTDIWYISSPMFYGGILLMIAGLWRAAKVKPEPVMMKRYVLTRTGENGVSYTYIGIDK